MKNMKQRKAFTIVEMVIVIAVIAILATVLIPTISGVIKKANISADTQFATSLTIQLAAWEADPDNGKIEDPEDLWEVIKEFYGEDFTLEPKSGKHGYHFYYDPVGKQVVLSEYEELYDKLSEPKQMAEDYAVLLSEGNNKPQFGAANPRSLMVKKNDTDVPRNAFLMDQGGSEVITVLNALNNMAGATDYIDQLNALKALADDGDDTLLAAAIRAKIEQTAIVTEYGAFRFAAVETVQYVYIAETVQKLVNVDVFEYNPEGEGDVQKDPEAVIADSADIQIALPKDVQVMIGGLTGINFPEDNTPNKDNTPELYVKATEDQLASIFEASSTYCVIVLPNGARYVIEGNQILRLPSREPIGESLKVESIDDIKIGYVDEADDANGTDNKDTDYFYSDAEGDNKTLYLALDHGSAQLKLEDGVSANMVNWTVSENAPIEISADGVITVKESFLQNPDKQNYTATITATLKADTSKTDTVDIYIVFPTRVEWSFGGELKTAPVVDSNIAINFTGANTTFPLSFVKEYLNQDGYAVMQNEITISFELGEGDLFAMSGSELVLDPAKLSDTNKTQILTVRYGAYVEETYTITVTDNSSSPFAVNKIVDNPCNVADCGKKDCDHNDVLMGATYLFRVGNGNSFELGKLFNSSKPADKITLKIYDAAKTVGGVRQQIATTGSGFRANYTESLTKDDWATSKIQFGGTGVAIIEITAKGTATTLAVEVVDGYNVTSEADLQDKQNNVLLNDIELKNKTYFSLTGTGSNSLSLFGNGFTFNIENGRITDKGIINLTNANLDNVRVIGSVYETLALTNAADYSSSAVYIRNGVISNSYISNCRSPIRVEGEVLLTNTVLDGGRYANVMIVSGDVTIDGVTTINEPRTSNKNVAGFGFVVAEEAAAGSVTITVTGEGLKQYNWITKDDASDLPDYKIAGISVTKTLLNTMFGNDCKVYQHTHTDGTVYVNTGIISFSSDIGEDDILWKAPYGGSSINVGVSGYVVSVLDGSYAMSAEDLKYRSEDYVWNPTKQGDTLPTFTWSAYGTGEVELTFDAGQEYPFDPHVLTAQKHNQPLQVVVTMDGIQYTGNIIFTESGEYKIEYTIKDPYVYNVDGSQRSEPAIYTRSITVKTNAVDKTVLAPEFTFTDKSGNTYTFKEVTVIVDGTERTYVMPDVTSADNANIGKTTVNGTTIYLPIITSYVETDIQNSAYRYFPILKGITIKNYVNANDKTGSVYNSSTTTLPNGLNVPTGTTGYGKIEELTYPAVRLCGNGANGWVEGTTKYENLLCMKGSAIAVDDKRATNRPGGYGYVEYSFTAGNEKTYYFRIGYQCPDAQKYSGCVTGDTLVTLADGTQKEIQQVTAEDMLLVWNHFTGNYEAVPAAIIFNHGYGHNTVIKLNFSDGTQVKVINLHQFLDVDLKKYVSIDASNVADYVGHSFAKQDGEGYTTVTLESYEISEEYIEAYGIISAFHYNILVEGMFSTDFMPEDYELFNYFTIGEGMVYDAELMQKDIEQYGLYTYEDFADYLTYEQFVAFNVQYFKIAVGKGHYTYEGILELINEYLNG